MRESVAVSVIESSGRVSSSLRQLWPLYTCARDGGAPVSVHPARLRPAPDAPQATRDAAVIMPPRLRTPALTVHVTSSVAKDV